MAMQALLALEDGELYRGEAFGAEQISAGEICFNTSMTGYQEILTDPSYRGQIVTMTYPEIGNYGTNQLDQESDNPHVRGFVIEQLSPIASNWRSEQSLDDYLKAWSIPGIQGIDTRKLTKHLRNRGAMKACLATKKISPDEAIRLANESSGVVGMDFVKEVTPTETYIWDPEDSLSREWTIVTGAAIDDSHLQPGPDGQVYLPLPPIRHRIVAYDLGMKKNILKRLRQSGFQITVVPATTPAAEVLQMNPDGVFFSNGPGDPAALDYVHETVRELVGQKPVFGICLGHQVIACALGAKTFKLKFGHRGANQPVKDLRSGKIAITSQNHGFAVIAEQMPECAKITHLNLNDNTVAGLEHRSEPVFCVQYHPEASPGPHDARYFFDQFANLIDQVKNN